MLTSLRLPELTSPKDCIFIGNGDSYVAGLISSYVSSFRSLCLTPLDIITFPKVSEGRHVYFVSVSGNTAANIRAAKVMNTRNVPSTAITMDRNSPIAKICNDVIKIDVPESKEVTSGTLTFTASTVICLSLISDIANTALIPEIYENCKESCQDYEDVNFKEQAYVILGNDFLYPCAMYGKLKINEIFGFPSIAYSSDEFFHAPIFGTRLTDYILLLEKKGIKQKEKKAISKLLSKVGIKNVSINCGNKSIFEIILTSIFLQQIIFVNQCIVA